MAKFASMINSPKRRGVVMLLAFAVVGGAFVFRSFAATPSHSFDRDVTQMSGGKLVRMTANSGTSMRIADTPITSLISKSEFSKSSSVCVRYTSLQGARAQMVISLYQKPSDAAPMNSSIVSIDGSASELVPQTACIKAEIPAGKGYIDQYTGAYVPSTDTAKQISVDGFIKIENSVLKSKGSYSQNTDTLRIIAIYGIKK